MYDHTSHKPYRQHQSSDQLGYMGFIVQTSNLDVNSFTVVIIRNMCLLILHLNVINSLVAQAHKIHLKCLGTTYG